MKACKKGFIPPGLKPKEFNEKKEFETALNLSIKKFEKSSLLLNSIPRYLMLLEKVKRRPFKYNFELLNLLLPNTINLVFDGLNSIAHFLEKLSQMFKSDCISLSSILNRQISSQNTSIATIKSI
jgi:hypothetical protein